eukprot:7680786-Alexandrium_andersonii.AAC.1
MEGGHADLLPPAGEFCPDLLAPPALAAHRDSAFLKHLVDRLLDRVLHLALGGTQLHGAEGEADVAP